MSKLRTISVQIDENLRLGQAIIVALERSGDLTFEVNQNARKYKITGVDIFHMPDTTLLRLLEENQAIAHKDEK